MDRLTLLCCLLLRGVGGGRLAYPGAVLVGRPPVRHPLPVARAVASDDVHQLGVVRRGVVVALSLDVPAQSGIGDGQAQHRSLLYAHVDEALPELVVTESLDLP